MRQTFITYHNVNSAAAAAAADYAEHFI